MSDRGGHGDALNRRRLLAASLVGAIGAATVGCGSNNTGAGASPNAADLTDMQNVRRHGAVGDGVADDTEAFERAARVGDGPSVLYLPAGVYRLTRWPDLADFSVVQGDGGDVSTVLYEEDGVFINLDGKNRIAFRQMCVHAGSPQTTAVRVSGSFRCSFQSVVIRGEHTSDSYPQYIGSRGVVLENNSGGTAFINCDINNFGVGIEVSCIQNYLTSSKLTTNYVGVRGSGDDHNAGLSVANSEFVSDTGANTTRRHIEITGAANDWWLTNVWFEGADVAISVGTRGKGGPSQFGMINCKVAARSVAVDLAYCRQPYLANVIFDGEAGRTPTELRIDPAGCPEGTAVNLISGSTEAISANVFPSGWNVLGRGSARLAPVTKTLVIRPESDDEALSIQGDDDSSVASVLSSGAWLSDRADAGLILKDSDGAYWRVTVSESGQLGARALGRDRPKR